MMEYIECQLILDHHFRGEQDLFEKEFPHLKVKAENLLGTNNYFAFSPLIGSPLSAKENPGLYELLMSI